MNIKYTNLVKAALFAHNVKTQISFDNYINTLTVHAHVIANSLSDCIFCGWFLRCVRCPLALEWI